MTSNRQLGSERRAPESQRQPAAKLYSLPHIRPSRYMGFSASRREARAWFQCHTARKRPQPAQKDPLSSKPSPVHPYKEHPGWPILRSLFNSVSFSGPASVLPDPDPRPTPAVLLFSIAGGVGKSTIAATLARVLAAKGEQVLAIDASSCGLLPFAFGSEELRPGALRTFGPPSGKPCVPVQTITLESIRQSGSAIAAEMVLNLLRGQTTPPDRIFIDAPTGSKEMASRLAPLEPLILVPLLPDVHSGATVSSIEALIAPAVDQKTAAEPYYLLNQFDPAQPRHRFVREALQAILGHRLLPLELHRDPAIPDALAEGMTILDYAPESQAAEEYRKLAEWLRTVFPPSSGWSSRRWSEQRANL